MSDAPRYRRWCVLAALVASALACGGGGAGPAEAPPIDFAPAPVPEASAATEGLAGELGLPIGAEMLKKNEERAVDLLFPSAFDTAGPFGEVVTHLEGRGWTRRSSEEPGPPAVFDQGDDTIEVSAELAGSSVWIRVRPK